MMNKITIHELRVSHSPQPLAGRVADSLLIAKEGSIFYIYDSAQTAGYLCATSNLSVVAQLLAMEEQSKGSVRTLITGEASPYDLSPPSPAQQTYVGEAKIDLNAVLNRRT